MEKRISMHPHKPYAIIQPLNSWYNLTFETSACMKSTSTHAVFMSATGGLLDVLATVRPCR